MKRLAAALALLCASSPAMAQTTCSWSGSLFISANGCPLSAESLNLGLAYSSAQTASATISAILNPVGATTFTLPTGAGNNGHIVQITRDTAPLDYVGTQTRASFVLQHRDDQALGNVGFAPGAVFQFNSTGNGYVVAGSDLSTSIWEGMLVTQTKSGDGSGQAVTLIGQLGAVGPGGYNELGGFQGILTNLGSTHGNISGYELVTDDGGRDTAMKNVIARVKRTYAGSRINTAFMGSSEGSVPVDSILTTNASAYNQWKTGLDLTAATFTTGQVAQFPNGTALAWKSSSGALVSGVGVSGSNALFLRPVATGGTVQMMDPTGAVVVQVGASETTIAGAIKATGLVDCATETRIGYLCKSSGNVRIN